VARYVSFRFGSSTRSNVALTSLAENGVPSWNFTLGRSLTSQVVSSTFFHDTARLGPTLPVLRSRAARWSKTWYPRMMLSRSTEFGGSHVCTSLCSAYTRVSSLVCAETSTGISRAEASRTSRAGRRIMAGPSFSVARR
jgi:hypothetical protein